MTKFALRGFSLSLMPTLEAGQTVYIQGEILWGWPAGRPKFTRMSDAEAQAHVAKLK